MAEINVYAFPAEDTAAHCCTVLCYGDPYEWMKTSWIEPETLRTKIKRLAERIYDQVFSPGPDFNG